MRSPWRALAFGVVVALGVLAADIVNLSAQASDPRIGTWKLNLAKSKFSPGPPPKALMAKVEPSGQGEKVATEGVNAEGAQALQQYLLAPATQARIRTVRYQGFDGQFWWPAGAHN